jgi:enhancing lycopene biosynthesis protein 2
MPKEENRNNINPILLIIATALITATVSVGASQLIQFGSDKTTVNNVKDVLTEHLQTSKEKIAELEQVKTTQAVMLSTLTTMGSDLNELKNDFKEVKKLMMQRSK